MNRKFYYLDAQTRHQLDGVLRGDLAQFTPADLWKQLCAALPLQRLHPETLRRRVEGMAYAADWLWQAALLKGKEAFGQEFDRENLLKSIRPVPISHYHYILGSREPRDLLRSRRDGLHDPQIALAKLQHDIEALADFMGKSKGALTGLSGDDSRLNPS
jgi:hypothetical protein